MSFLVRYGLAAFSLLISFAAGAQSGLPATSNAVVVAGTVPDEATHQVILRRVREVYGADRVVDQLAVGAVVAPANWSNYVQRLISPALKHVRRGELAVSGNTVEIKGEVGNEATRQQVVSEMSTQLNPTYVVRNGLRMPSNDQSLLDHALGNRIVEFESGSATLTPEGRDVLDDIIAPLKALPASSRVQIIGHTDNLGSRDANLALAAARADSVKFYLAAHAIADSMLETSGAGSDRPVASNATAEGRARNRRIEFRVSKQ
jgi:OOP family OmpA-OmpF porin